MARKYTQEEIEMILNKHDCELLSEYKKGMTLGSAAKEKQNSPYVQKCA